MPRRDEPDTARSDWSEPGEQARHTGHRTTPSALTTASRARKSYADFHITITPEPPWEREADRITKLPPRTDIVIEPIETNTQFRIAKLKVWSRVGHWLFVLELASELVALRLCHRRKF